MSALSFDDPWLGAPVLSLPNAADLAAVGITFRACGVTVAEIADSFERVGTTLRVVNAATAQEIADERAGGA